jgi:hypothetical protein
MNRFRVVLIWVLMVTSASAEQRMAVDTTDRIPRMFSAKRIEKWKQDPTLRYSEGPEGPKSDLRRFWEWALSKLSKAFDIASPWVGSLILLGLILVVLVILVYGFRGLSRGGLLSRNNPDEGLDYHADLENIHTIQFEDEIRRAIQSKNFRLAVRLMYLQVLKNLADKGFIRWEENKTNAAYQMELQGGSLSRNFGELTFHFESNWYGAVPIEEKEFLVVSERFQFFKTVLNQS